jgi:hypothetical protein
LWPGKIVEMQSQFHILIPFFSQVEHSAEYTFLKAT